MGLTLAGVNPLTVFTRDHLSPKNTQVPKLPEWPRTSDLPAASCLLEKLFIKTFFCFQEFCFINPVRAFWKLRSVREMSCPSDLVKRI